MIKKFIKRLYKKWASRLPDEDRLTYWEKRAKQMGDLAVLDRRHKEHEIDAVTEFQVNQILPYLKREIQTDNHTILDFGCGTGRFIPYLQKLTQGQVIGVDPIQSLLDRATKLDRVKYHLLRDGKVPLDSNSIDLLWITLVLGGIQDQQLPSTVQELMRVMKNNALICLVENTSKKPNAAHWTFRRKAFYQNLFPNTFLFPVNAYNDFDEEITVFVGRLVKTAES
ncbi:MAG: class I SAM-dependent methyltransferase [Cyclobacteriaceae bacterium]|jgi:ubiquinone/menaquinone biosynthesis C-methylase UbiE|nr:class I SAM-dependent methyltransferase [Cyclobacteriaceae bacterium]